MPALVGPSGGLPSGGIPSGGPDAPSWPHDIVVTQGTPTALITAVRSDGTVISDISRDLLYLQTEKETAEPNGMWSMRLAQRPDAQGRTWLDRLRPMDYIEIRLGYRTSRSGLPPVVMRGYIDTVNDELTLADDGAPQRTAIINGEDLGKGLLTKTLWIPAQQLDFARYSTNYDFEQTFWWGNTQVTTGAEYGPTPRQFMTDYIQRLYDAALVGPVGTPAPGVVQVESTTEVLQKLAGLEFSCTIPEDGRYTCFPAGLAMQEMSLWSMCQYFQSAPFSELFVRDDQDAARLYWRIPPYYGIDGTFLDQTGAVELPLPDPTQASQMARRVLSSSLTKADADVVNYVAVWAAQGLAAPASNQAASIGPNNPAIDDASIALFGFRAIRQAVTFVNVLSGTTLDVVNLSQTTAANTCGVLADWALKAFGNNQDLVSGQITVAGTADVVIGTYILLAQDATTGRAIVLPGPGRGGAMRLYVESVSQQFDPTAARWTTTLGVTRGARIP